MPTVRIYLSNDEFNELKDKAYLFKSNLQEDNKTYEEVVTSSIIEEENSTDFKTKNAKMIFELNG